MRQSKTTRWVLVLLCGLIILASGCGTPRAKDFEQWQPEERLVLKFSHVVAENTPKGLAARRFATLVAERSGGRIEVQVFPDGQLYGDGEEIQALMDGKVQFIAPSTGKLAELFPEWQLFDLPYAFADEAAVVTAMEGPIGQKLFRLMRRRGLMGITMWDNGWKHMTSSVSPLILPSDFAGQRFRIQPSRILQEQFRTLGASGVPVGFDQTYKALESGLVDGEENTASNIYSKKFHQVQKYMTLSNHGYLGYVVLTNADYWQSLPPDVQSVLQDALTETTRWVRANAAGLNEADLQRIRESGRLTIHQQTSEERQQWEAAFSHVYDLYATGIDPELADALKALRRR